MKIAHISDIHASKSYFLTDVADKVVDWVNDIKPEILIISGDLTMDAFEPEFKQAKEFIDRIKAKEKIIVPGNHDKRNLGYKGFEEIFGPRSSVHRCGGITIVGIDSAQPDEGEGYVGINEYKWIEDSFETYDFKVAVLHHHLLPVPKTGKERNVLIDAGDMLELFVRRGVDLVLCGHKHISWWWSLNDLIVLNAGTATSNRVNWGIPQSFNLIEVTERKKSRKMTVHRLFPTTGKIKLVLKKEKKKCL